jgi:hypothetical protein
MWVHLIPQIGHKTGTHSAKGAMGNRVSAGYCAHEAAVRHKPRNIKYSAVSILDRPSLVQESASQVSRNTSLRCFSRDSPDGHNGTQALSRSLSPGKLGYSTFVYPV